jgi:hypothetical protein
MLNRSRDERLARAKDILAAGPTGELEHAALELRMCIETMTYEKLNAARQYLPESIFRIWQAPQALKALLQFDDIADQGFTLHMGDEVTPGEPSRPDQDWKLVGEHRTFSTKWLTKNYNKLGSMLHSPIEPVELGNSELGERHKYLLEIVTEIERVQAATILSWFMATQMFSCECPYCGGKVSASRHYIETMKSATCLNWQCNAEFDAGFNPDGSSYFSPRETGFDCHVCKVRVVIQERDLKKGLRVFCRGCDAEYEIRPKWQAGRLAPQQSAAGTGQSGVE